MRSNVPTTDFLVLVQDFTLRFNILSFAIPCDINIIILNEKRNVDCPRFVWIPIPDNPGLRSRHSRFQRD